MNRTSVAQSVPPRVERALRIARDPRAAYERDRLLRRLAKEPGKLPTSATLRRLKDAWGGGGTADVVYMQEMCERAIAAEQPILECGSGLTTLLLGIFAHVPVVALEESVRWAARMKAALGWYRLSGVTVAYAPIVDHGGYTWYSLPPDLPPRFSLVVCDGPIAHNRSGSPRYGVVPALRERFDESSVILLDDVARPTEATALSRWEAEGLSASIVGEAGRAFAIVTFA